MHPAEAPPRRATRPTRASTSASTRLRCSRRMGEELAQVIEERLDVGPGTQQLARVWGHGIVGMMHAAGDWWLGERPAPGPN
ncbi:hypothetical protein LV779_24105 [Streptomyces thinghirensis]|nr:hypothetical protein [Streptomyces thinghirensis]